MRIGSWTKCDLECKTCARAVCSGARALIEEREAEEKAGGQEVGCRRSDGGAQ